MDEPKSILSAAALLTILTLSGIGIGSAAVRAIALISRPPERAAAPQPAVAQAVKEHPGAVGARQGLAR